MPTQTRRPDAENGSRDLSVPAEQAAPHANAQHRGGQRAAGSAPTGEEEESRTPCSPRTVGLQTAVGLSPGTRGPFLTMRQEVWPAGLDRHTRSCWVCQFSRDSPATNTWNPFKSTWAKGRIYSEFERLSRACGRGYRGPAVGRASVCCPGKLSLCPSLASADVHFSACMADSGATMTVKPTLFLCRRTASPSQNHRVQAP